MLHFSFILVLLQVAAIDVALAGDNAIAVGVAASGLPARERHKAVFMGIGAAACLRILFAIFAVQLLHITGLLAAGGLVLVWVAWKMYRDIRRTAGGTGSTEISESLPTKTFASAVLQITIADISMSLDNVLAVAGAARNHPAALVAGLVLSVVLVGAAAAWIAKLTARHKWIAWIGVAIVFLTALQMMWVGGYEVMQVMG